MTQRQIRTKRPAERGESGAILILTSLLVLSLLTFTAYSVDIGHESEVKRHLNAVADIAALDGLYGLGSDNAMTNVVNLVVASAAHNGHPLTGSNHLTIEIGTWTGSPRQFQSFSPPCVVTLPGDVIPACPDAATANADRVSTSASVIWNFVNGSQGLTSSAGSSGPIPTSTTSPTTTSPTTTVPCPPGGCPSPCPPAGCPNPCPPGACPTATFIGQTGLEIGTYDANASLTAGQTAILNGALDLSAVSYAGLAGANIKLRDLATQLGFGSVNDLVNGSTTYEALLSAGARALSNSGDSSAATSLAGIAAGLAAGGNANVKAGSVLSLGPLLTRVSSNGAGSFGQGSVLAGSGGIDALSLVTGGFDAALINGTSFATLNGLNLSVPNVTSVDAGVKVLSAPNWGFGPGCNVTTSEPGNLATCAQAWSSQIEGQVVAHLPQVVVPITALGNATISANLPLYFDNAAAHAWVSNVTCANATDHQAPVDAWGRTGLAHIAIGQNATLTSAASQQDFTSGTAGSISLVGPDNNPVSVHGVTYTDIAITQLGIDIKVANNGTVTVLSNGPSLLQPTTPPPNPTVPSYSGPFLKPPAEQLLSGASLGFRGPDKATSANFSTGTGITPVNPTGNAVQDALTSLAQSLPSLTAQLDAGLTAAGVPAATRTTVENALSTPLTQEAATINSVISAMGQTIFAPLAAAFEASLGGATVTNLAARDQAPPDGIICVPAIVH